MPIQRAPWPLTRPSWSQPWASLKPCPHLAHDVARRYPGVLEEDLERCVAHHGGPAALDGHAGVVHVHQEAANSTPGALLGIGDRHDLGEVGGARVADKALGAVQHPLVAVQHRPGLHARGVAAGIGLGLGEAGGLLAAEHRVEIALLLLVVALEQDAARLRAKDRVVAEGDGDGPGYLLLDHAAGQQIEPGAAVLGGHVEHPEPQGPSLFLERLVQLLGHLLALRAEFPFQRDQLPVHEIAHGVLDDLYLFGKLEIHSSPPCLASVRLKDGS